MALYGEEAHVAWMSGWTSPEAEERMRNLRNGKPRGYDQDRVGSEAHRTGLDEVSYTIPLMGSVEVDDMSSDLLIGYHDGPSPEAGIYGGNRLQRQEVLTPQIGGAAIAGQGPNDIEGVAPDPEHYRGRDVEIIDLPAFPEPGQETAA